MHRKTELRLSRAGRSIRVHRTFAAASYCPEAAIPLAARRGPRGSHKDALIDLTNRGDVVLDPFLGSGSSLIAREGTGRICYGVELDPLYVDVIIRRYAAVTGKSAVLVETGETFEALALRRAAESQQPDAP
jgi:hypothetical protein